MSNKQSARNPSLDLIRCVALLCVIGIHFFINSGFHAEIISGFSMYILLIIRSAMQVCVPLFLMLSGYLLRFRKPTKQYYLKIIRTLTIYCCATILCILYQNFEGTSPVSLKEAISGLFGYNITDYAWYIEMYIGLFLIIPFLNVMYNNLENKKTKQLLIMVLLFSTAFPSVVNIWRFFDPHWWLQPSSSANYNAILPNWWIWMYPISYYCIGCYLNEYPLKLKQHYILLSFFVSIFISGSFNYYRSYGSAFVCGPWQDFESLLVTVPTILLFAYLANLDMSRLPITAKRILALLSDCCLGAYLVSWIFDQVFYKIVNAHMPIMQDKIVYFPIIISVIYLCSLVTSAGINFLIGSVSKIIQSIASKSKLNTESF